MAKNNVDVELLAGLSIDSSEAEILKAIKIIEKRLKANHDARFKLNIDIDETVIRNTVDKLQNILKGKELKIDTKSSIEAITKEVNAMGDIVTVAKKAANEKLAFAKANERVRNSADNTADAVNRERDAMNSFDDVETVLNSINRCGQNGNSVFQRFGSTLQEAFSAYTTVNLLERGLNKVVDAGKEALEIVKEFDDINVDLQLASGEDKGYVKQLLNDYSELGSELGALTQTVAESSDTFLRQGRSIPETNQLIENSIILSKVAKTDGEKASEILTATINGFQLAASEGSRVNDVLSSIDLNSASSAQGIGTALTKVASMANSAGISLEKTASMAAVLKETTQDADETIGTSIKTMLSRMNQIRAGKFVDEETGEALNDVEKVLNKIGISMRDNITGQFKESEVIIDEIGRKWSTFDENSKKAAQFALGGAYQANKVVALFDNYEKVLELTNIAENSAGQALEKFNESYLPSLEAKTQALQNSLQQLYTTTISDDLYASVLDVSKEVVDLTTETGILKSALAGIGVGGSLYAFSQLATFMREATQGFSNFSNALNMVNRGAVTTANDMQTLVNLSHGLSNSQMRLLLSTNNLTDAQKISLMVANGVEQELAEQQLRTWGLINAQNTMTGVTATLTSAVRGFIATLAANPIILVTMAVTAGVTAFNKYKQAQEEVIQTAREASAVYKDNTNSIDDYVAKYEELHKALQKAKGNEEETYNVKQQLLELQTELNKKYANEADRLNLVTNAYKDQTEAIKELSKASANEFLNSNRKGIEKANKEMNRENAYQLGSMNGLVNADELDILEQIKAIAESNGIDFTDTGFEFISNANEATDVINSFMNDIKELQVESGKTSDVMSGIFDGILDSSSGALGKADSIIDKYGDIYEQAQMATIASNENLSNGYNEVISAVEAYNEAVLKSEDPYNDENVKVAWDNLQTVKNGIQENEEEWGQYSNIVDNIFASADDKVYSFYDAMKNDNTIAGLVEELRGLSDVEVQSMVNDGNEDAFDKLTEQAKAYGLEVQDVIDLLKELGYIITNTASSNIEFFKFDQSSFNESIKSHEDKYNRLIQLQEDFNNGVKIMSASTFIELQESGLLEYINLTSDGLDINTEKLLSNAQSCKDKAVADLHAAMTSDMLAIAINDTSNISETAKSVIEQLGNNAEIAGDKAISSVSDWATLGATISQVMDIANIRDISVDQRKQMSEVYDYYKNLAKNISKIDITTDATTSARNKAKENAEKAAKEASEKAKQYIESYIEFQKRSLEKGQINYNTYCNTISNLLKSMFKEGKISAQEYHEYNKEMLESQKNIYDKVLSAVQRRFDKEISKIEEIIKSIEKQNDVLEKQKTLMDDASSAVIDYYDSLIDAENKSIDSLNEANDGIQTKIDKYNSLVNVADKLYENEQKALEEQKQSLQDNIDLLQEENKEKDLQYRKEQALYALQQSQNQRTKRVLTEDGFVYQTDDKAISEAKKNVEDIKTEELISSLEKEQEILQSSIDSLQEYRDMLSEIAGTYDEILDIRNAIELIGDDYVNVILGTNINDWLVLKDKYVSANDEMANNDKLIKSHEDKIKIWEEEKSQWENLSNVIDDETKNQAAIQEFGTDWQEQINQGRLNNYEEFKNKYLAIQSQIDDNTSMIDSYNEKIAYYEDLKKQWSNIADAYEQSVEDQYAAMVLGVNWENDILSGRLDVLNDFKNEYIGIQQAIVDEAWRSANEQNKALESIKSGSGSNNNSANNNIPTNNNTNDKPETTSTYKDTPYWVYKTLGTYSTSGEAHSKIGIHGGNDVIKVGNNYEVIKWIRGYATSGEAHSGIGLVNGNGVYKRYHSGLKEGIIGSNKTNKDFELIKHLGLNPDEVPIIARDGESVITRNQMGNLSDNFRKMMEYAIANPIIPNYVPNYSIPNYSHLGNVAVRNTQSMNLSIGDIHVHKPIGNVDTLSNAIINELPNKMLQAIHRR